MELLTGNVRPLYFKYLMAASGSALVASIFGVVDAMLLTEDLAAIYGVVHMVRCTRALFPSAT